jgi:hypothetical protein
VVDVPGHEAFVRTMLAGATGVDVALLVVAADEGVMPRRASTSPSSTCSACAAASSRSPSATSSTTSGASWSWTTCARCWPAHGSSTPR